MRKNLFAIIALFLGLLPVASQNAQRPPLLTDGKTWDYAMGNEWRGYEEYRQTVDGDTVIGGITWKKVYREQPIGTTPRYEKAMREEDDKVYVWNGEDTQLLFVDYGASVGTSIPCKGPSSLAKYSLEVTTVASSVLAEGSPCRTLTLRQIMEYYDGVEHDIPLEPFSQWTEGIGGDLGIDEAVVWHDLVGMEFFLLSCKDGERVLYSDNSLRHQLGLDNEQVGIPQHSLTGRGDSNGTGTLLYDIRGCHVLPHARRGVYFSNGRKIIVDR